MPEQDGRDCEGLVKWFGERMKEKLQRNSHKSSWLESSIEYLYKRLVEEARELRDAIIADDPRAVVSECSDVGNFAAMIADKARCQGLPEQGLFKVSSKAKTEEPVRKTDCRKWSPTLKGCILYVREGCGECESYEPTGEKR